MVIDGSKRTFQEDDNSPQPDAAENRPTTKCHAATNETTPTPAPKQRATAKKKCNFASKGGQLKRRTVMQFHSQSDT